MTDKSESGQFESQLREALRPIEPEADFVQGVLARLPQASTASKRASNRWRRSLRWVPVALAASLVAVVLIRHELQLRHELEEGRRAREQLIEALRVTSEQLDHAYRAVNGRAKQDSDADTSI